MGYLRLSKSMNYYIIKVCTEYHKVCTKLEAKRLIKSDKCVPIITKYAPISQSVYTH